MNVKMDSKYYSVDDALKMLPYIKSYCKDIKECYGRVESLTATSHKLSNLTSLSKIKKQKIKTLEEKIQQKIEIHVNRFKRWRNELEELFIIVCSAKHGRVDIPIYYSDIETIASLCVTPETSLDDIEWHLTEESHENARKYFEKVF